MIHRGMDVHQKSTTFCLFDPSAKEDRQYRTVTQPTTKEATRRTLAPLGGPCQVAYEVGTQAQWIAAIVRPLAADVQVANPSRIPWLFRDGRKNYCDAAPRPTPPEESSSSSYNPPPGPRPGPPPALAAGVTGRVITRVTFPSPLYS